MQYGRQFHKLIRSTRVWIVITHILQANIKIGCINIIITININTWYQCCSFYHFVHDKCGLYCLFNNFSIWYWITATKLYVHWRTVSCTGCILRIPVAVPILWYTRRFPSVVVHSEVSPGGLTQSQYNVWYTRRFSQNSRCSYKAEQCPCYSTTQRPIH